MRRHYRRHWVVLFFQVYTWYVTRIYVRSSPISIINVRFFLFLLQACAPRYVYYIFMGRKDPVGMCFIARNIISRNNFTSIRAHRPCVESGIGCSNFEQIFLICFFSLFLPTPPSLNLFSSKKYASVSLVCSYIKLSENSLKKYENYRHAHQDMCGTREILKDGNPSELVTRLGTISTNFLNIHRVEQVSVYKLCFWKAMKTTRRAIKKLFASFRTKILNFVDCKDLMGYVSVNWIFLTHKWRIKKTYNMPVFTCNLCLFSEL